MRFATKKAVVIKQLVVSQQKMDIDEHVMNTQSTKKDSVIIIRKASGFFLDTELEKALYRLEERGLVESVNDDEYQITFRRIA